MEIKFSLQHIVDGCVVQLLMNWYLSGSVEFVYLFGFICFPVLQHFFISYCTPFMF